MTAQELMKQYVLQVLQRVEHRKKERGIEPSFTTAMEFKAELRTDLRAAMLSLEKEGKIHQGPTLNDYYMELI